MPSCNIWLTGCLVGIAHHVWTCASGQCGRGLGPVAASAFYDWFIGVHGRESGLSAATIYEVGCVFFGVLLPFLRFGVVFGDWSEL